MSFKFWTALPGARYFLLDFCTKARPYKKPWKRDPVLFDTSSNGSCLISSLNESAELAFEGGPDELVSCPPLCWWLTVSAIVDGKRSAPPLICFATRLVLHFKHGQHSHHYNLLGDFCILVCRFLKQENAWLSQARIRPWIGPKFGMQSSFDQKMNRFWYSI